MGCEWDLKRTKSDLIEIIFKQFNSVYDHAINFIWTLYQIQLLSKKKKNISNSTFYNIN